MSVENNEQRPKVIASYPIPCEGVGRDIVTPPFQYNPRHPGITIYEDGAREVACPSLDPTRLTCNSSYNREENRPCVQLFPKRTEPGDEPRIATLLNEAIQREDLIFPPIAIDKKPLSQSEKGVEFFRTNPRRIISRTEISQAVGGAVNDSAFHNLMTNIRNILSKENFTTVRRRGYMYEPPGEETEK
jgi:hypothetical protein